MKFRKFWGLIATFVEVTGEKLVWAFLLECFVILIYDKKSTQTKVNEACREQFRNENKAFENLPPTHDALIKHVKRPVFLGSVIAIPKKIFI